MTLATRTQAAPGGSVPYEPGAFYDEALLPDGSARPHYGSLIEELAEVDLTALTGAIARAARARNVTFGSDTGPQRFHVDPVPRVLAAGVS